MSGIEVIAVGLMAYAAWSTGLPNPNELPKIEVMPRCEIENLYYGYEPGTTCMGASAIGATYNFDDGTLRYPEEIPIMSVRGKSFLLHELVHYVQHQAILEGNAIMIDVLNSSSCQNEAFEPMAYRAQFEWLRMNKADPWATIPTHQTLLFMSMTCRAPEISSNIGYRDA